MLGMSTADFIILVLAAIAGIAAAGGGIVLTLTTPKYAAARTAFCVAATCVMLVGVVWGVTAEHSSMWARYLGAGLTGAAAATGLVWILTHLHETKPEASLFLECTAGTLPRVFPPSGRFYVTDILPILFNNSDRVSLGLGYHFGTAGAPAIPPESFQLATECKLTNYGNLPIFNAVLSARATFTEAHRPEGQTNGWQSGPVKAIKQASITVPKIDAGKDSPFVFYLKSQSADFVNVEFLPEVTLQEGSDPTSRLGRVIIPAHTHINFSPYEPSARG
jgi:hypothetical protein